MSVYKPNKHGEADYNSWTGVSDIYVPAGATGSPTSGYYAQMVHVVNPTELSLSGDLNLSLESENDFGTVAPPTVVQFGGIAETAVPAVVADGETVAQWFDEYGRPVMAGYNHSVDALDVNIINQAMLNRLGPVTTLSAGVTGTGVSIDVSNYRNHTLHINATGATVTAIVNIEQSLDNSIWANIATLSLVASGTTEVAVSDVAYRYLRGSCTNWTAGTIGVELYSGN